MNILAFVESRAGKIKGAGLEALSLAGNLAREQSGSYSAILIGKDSSSLAQELKKYGPAKIFVAEAPELAGYTPEGYREAILAAIAQSGADVVVLSATTMGRDIAPVLAARLKAAFLPDCVSVGVEDGKITVKRPVYAGRCLMTLAANSLPAVISLRPKAFLATPGGEASSEIVNLSLDLSGKLKSRFIEEKSEAVGKLDVSDADVIVSGGRGLKVAENFQVVEELAVALGAAVGASRAVVDAGWRPHSEQVGQTGKVVNPTLYIACGISGAIQHLAGMRSSKVIVAINKDPEAPIFKTADYGIVGDAMEVVPALTRAVKALG